MDLAARSRKADLSQRQAKQIAHLLKHRFDRTDKLIKAVRGSAKKSTLPKRGPKK